MAITLTDINVGSAPNDGTGDTARTAGQSINANNTTLETAIGGLQGRFWTIQNSSTTAALGDRLLANNHAGITLTMPGTFANDSTAYSDIWIANADDASNVTLTPASGDAFFVDGATYGVDTSYSLTPGNMAILSPRTTDSEWDLVLVGGGASGGGAFTADGNTLITPTTAIVLDQDTGDEAALTLNYTTNKLTSGNDTGLVINQTDTLSPGTSLLLDLQVASASKFSVDNAGAVAATSYSSGGATNYLMYSGASWLAFISGNRQFSIQGTQIGLTSTQYFGFSATNDPKAASDTRLYRDAANTLALRNSTNPQTFNVYNTYTDASNYERGFARWNTDVFEVGSEAAGTGTARDTKIITASGNLYFEQTTGNDFDVFFNTANGVQFVQNTDVTVGHMWTFQSSATAEVTSSSAAQATVFIDGDCRQSGTAAYDALLVDGTLETNGDGSAGDGNNILRLTNAATTQFKVATDGVITADAAGHTVAGLPASPAVGMIARVTDANSPAVGSTVAGSGSSPAMVWYNGTNWTVIGV